MAKSKPRAKTVRAAIRGAVPDAKLRKARIALTDGGGFAAGVIGGFTQYEKEHGGDVVKIGAPIGDDAYGLTVRGHETMHATRHKPQRKKPMSENQALASQIVDDVNIETTALPRAKAIRPYKRARLAVALRDLRTIVNRDRKVKAGREQNSIAHRNAQILLAVRASSMLRHYGYEEGKYHDSSDEAEVAHNSLGILRDIVGKKTMNAIRKVQLMAQKRRSRNRAISMLTALMETAPTEEEEERAEEEFRRDGDILAPVQEGDGLDGKMEIRNLIPKTIPCSKEKQIHRRLASDGVIINPVRFVNAIANNDANGLFARRVREKAGGTILIDASGSMSANSRNLTALCELCPTATVAYYSGTGTGRGELCIYALNGKRYAKELPANSIHGGNAVDLPAIRWMMRLPKPWTLISDLGFCGGVLGSEIVAHALVEQAVKRGDLTVYDSLDAAYEAFGGKGELRN